MTRPQTIIPLILGILLSTPALASGVCVIGDGGCRDPETGTVYEFEDGGKLVDPQTKKVWADAPQDDPEESVIITRFPSWVPPRRPADNRRPEVDRDAVAEPASSVEERRPVGSRSPYGRVPPPNIGAINPVTGEFYAPAGSGYVNTRDGRYYAPAGPNGVIDTRTGQFIPVH